MFGSIAGPAILQSAKRSLPKQKTLLKSIGSTIGALLDGSKAPAVEEAGSAMSGDNDINYVMQLSRDELQNGKVIQVVSQGPGGQEMLKVTIPPASRSGQKLRLRGKGQASPLGRGDLYLELKEQ